MASLSKRVFFCLSVGKEMNQECIVCMFYSGYFTFKMASFNATEKDNRETVEIFE